MTSGAQNSRLRNMSTPGDVAVVAEQHSLGADRHARCHKQDTVGGNAAVHQALQMQMLDCASNLQAHPHGSSGTEPPTITSSRILLFRSSISTIWCGRARLSVEQIVLPAA